MAKRTYRSMMGKIVDMELLSQRNELTPAIGNAKVNARGDELGPGGRIIRKREEIMAEYYDNNPASVKDEQYIRQARPAEPVATTSKESTRKTTVNKKEVINDDKEDQTNS